MASVFFNHRSFSSDTAASGLLVDTVAFFHLVQPKSDYIISLFHLVLLLV